MNIARRGLLRVLGAAPVAAKMMADEAAARLAGLAGGTVAPALLPSPGGIGNTKPRSYLNFGQWFEEIGHDQLREEASYVQSLDPDLAAMQLPLCTKVRMQRARQYSRYLEGRKRWFNRSILFKGVVEWWPCPTPS